MPNKNYHCQSTIELFRNGVLKPLDPLDLEEGREVKIIVMDESFYNLAEELEIESEEDIDDILKEIRKHRKSLDT